MSAQPATRVVRSVAGLGAGDGVVVPSRRSGGAVREVAAALDLSRGGTAFVDEVLAPLDRETALVSMASLRCRAGEFLARYACEDEVVAVFGDYDVDGVSSMAVAVAGLAALRIGEDEVVEAWERHGLHALCLRCGLMAVVPERREGYGLSCGAVARLASRGIRRLVCVDNGTNAVAALRLALAQGIEVVVLDHHPPRGEALGFWSDPALSPGVAIANPWIEGPLARLASSWRCGRNLCATVVCDGVVAQAMERTGRFDPWSCFFMRTASLAAVATVADMMPLVSANRGVVRDGFGFLDIGQAPPGLRHMRDLVFAKRAIGPSDGNPSWGSCAVDGSLVGFQLAPRINACGRMGDAARAFDLVAAADAQARAFVDEVDVVNDSRRDALDAALERAQGIVGEAFANATATPLAALCAASLDGAFGAASLAAIAGIAGRNGADVSYAVALPGLACLYVASDLGDGLAGLVAGRLAEALSCPAVVLAGPHASGAMGGSGRVPEGSPLVVLGEELSEIFVAAALCHGGSGGGHSAAFGLRLRVEGDAREQFRAMRKFLCEAGARLVRALAREVGPDGAGLAVAAVPTAEVSVAADDSCAAVGSCVALGPFGRGLREPLVHLSVGACSTRPMGSKGTFRIEAAGGGLVPCVAFPSSFPGLDLSEVEAGFGAGAFSLLGRPRLSFYGKGRYGRGGDLWRGAAPEIVVEAILEGA